MRKLALTGALLGGALVAMPAASQAGVFISVAINAPPALPVYAQPEIPAPGYIWTPGYWAYGDAGYYWIPGAWVEPPTVGVLWTPPYWGYDGGRYAFHAGYWGPTVGFYGGINYGFGYTGVGFAGGYWHGRDFFYNRAYANVGNTYVHNTYVRNVTVVNTYRTSYNGGPGGLRTVPTANERQAFAQHHYAATTYQQQQFRSAYGNRAQYASVNGGRPATAAFEANRAGFGHGNEVNTRQGNQQSRVEQGVRSGELTPGETRNVENRDKSINRQAQTDRAHDGGALTPAERQQINQRQNNVSRSIYNDRHNANTDAAAAARSNRSAYQEQRQAQTIRNQSAPRGPQAHEQAPQRAPQARPQEQHAPEGHPPHGRG
jgi:hypothetical protein